jgi:hypothetical protein
MSYKRPSVVDTTLKNLGINPNSDITAISQIPEELNSVTKTAIIASARQESLHGGVSDSLYNVVQKLSEEEIANETDSKLSNFKPAVLAGNVIQRRKNINSVEGSDNPDTPSAARKNAIAGLDPSTIAIRDQIEKLQQLADQKNVLSAQADAIKSQIDELVARLNGTTEKFNTEQVQMWQQQLDLLQKTYDVTTALIAAATTAYNLRYETLQKLKLQYKTKKKQVLDAIDKYELVLNLPEIPTSINWPKLPKLPNVNLSKVDFKQQVSNFVTSVINASKSATKASLEQADKEYQAKLLTEKQPQDAFSQAISSAKKALGAAEARINALNAAKQAAITTATGALTSQIDGLVAGAALTQRNIASNIGNVATQIDQNIQKIQEAQRQAEALKNGVVQNADRLTQDTANLLQRASAGIESAQNALRGEQVKVDITANTPVTSNPIYTVDEQTKLDALQANITAFLNAGAHSNSKVGVGKGNTLRAALNQSLKLQEFKTEFPLAFTNNLYDKRNEISNINGVYLVVTAVYQTVPIKVPAPPAPQPPEDTKATTTIPPSEKESPTATASGSNAEAPTATASGSNAEAPPVTPTVSTIAVPDAASAILDIFVNGNTKLPRKDYTKLDSIMSTIETGLSNGKTYSSEVMARYNFFEAYFKKLDADRLNSDINNQEMILGNDKSRLDSAKIRLDADPTEAVYQTVYNNRLREYNQSLSYLNELKAKKSSME